MNRIYPLRLLCVILALSSAVPTESLSDPTERPNLVETAITKEEAASLVVLSLPFYAAKKGPDTGGSAKLAIDRFTMDALPAKGKELADLLSKKSSELVDVENRRMFWQFSIVLKTGETLTINAAANRVMGSPIISLMVSKGEDISAVKKFAEELVRKLVPDVQTPGTLVVHAYPRIGLLFQAKNGRRFVIDLTSYRLYDVRSELERIKQWRVSVWSPFDRLSLLQAKWYVTHFSWVVTRRQFYSDKYISLEECREIESGFVLSTQENYAWCAPATAQMIFKYLGINFTQSFAAEKMNTDLDTGTQDLDEIAGYQELAAGAFGPYYQSPPQFDLIKAEICSKRPVRLGIPGHVVAATGVRFAETTQQLTIYDPGWLIPPNSNPYVKEWDSLMTSGPFPVNEAPLGFYDTIFLRPSPPPSP